MSITTEFDLNVVVVDLFLVEGHILQFFTIFLVFEQQVFGRKLTSRIFLQVLLGDV